MVQYSRGFKPPEQKYMIQLANLMDKNKNEKVNCLYYKICKKPIRTGNISVTLNISSNNYRLN